jgi:hypothetical protein
VRRSFAGLFFGLAFMCACLAISGFVLSRTAFSPSNTEESAGVVLGDAAVEQELVDRIAAVAAPQIPPGGIPGALGQPTPQNVSDFITQHVLSTSDGKELLSGILRNAHAKLIGDECVTDDGAAPACDAEGNPQITGEQMVQIVRNESVAGVAPIVLEVETVGALEVAKDITSWLVPILALAALAFLVLCFLAHPERAALIRTLGLGLLVLAALILLFAYVIPKLVPTLLTDSVWARIPPRLADDSLPLTLGAVLLLTGGGLALFVASSRMGRSRRWSTPVSTYRYREERNWS